MEVKGEWGSGRSPYTRDYELTQPHPKIPIPLSNAVSISDKSHNPTPPCVSAKDV